MNEKLYQYKKQLWITGLLLTFLGIALGYLTYEKEPWETIAGAICGAGFSLFILMIFYKKPIQQN